MVSLLFFAFLAQSQTAPERPRIFGIAAVRILTTNIPGDAAFCARAFGTNETGHNAFRLNPRQAIELFQAPSPTPSSLLAEVVFQTENLGELMKYFAAQKIKATPKLTNSAPHFDVIGPAYSALSVTDPEGHRISFVAGIDAHRLSGSSNAAPPSNALHLIHAGFIVRDRAATEHFYKDILGFRPYWHGGMKDDGKDDWVSLQVPDGTDWIEMMVNVEANADQRVRGIMNHIAVGVTDIHATEQRLKDAGVNLTEQPQIGRDGKWQLNVYDPDLTRIEFMEFTPVQKPCCSDFTGPHPQP